MPRRTRGAAPMPLTPDFCSYPAAPRPPPLWLWRKISQLLAGDILCRPHRASVILAASPLHGIQPQKKNRAQIHILRAQPLILLMIQLTDLFSKVRAGCNIRIQRPAYPHLGRIQLLARRKRSAFSSDNPFPFPAESTESDALRSSDA